MSADTGRSQELVSMTRRFQVGVALSLSLPVLVLSMGGEIYFEAASVITRLVRSGRCSSCGPANRPRAPSGRCWT